MFCACLISHNIMFWRLVHIILWNGRHSFSLLCNIPWDEYTQFIHSTVWTLGCLNNAAKKSLCLSLVTHTNAHVGTELECSQVPVFSFGGCCQVPVLAGQFALPLMNRHPGWFVSFLAALWADFSPAWMWVWPVSGLCVLSSWVVNLSFCLPWYHRVDL